MSALEGASKYLNNLLLARGLLTAGKPIDFAHPEHGSEETDATMSKVINLVHDLVLRRDREAEQREAMAEKIRNMQSEETQRVLDVQRLQDRNSQLKNSAAAAEAQERGLRETVRRVEKQAKEQKEQLLKMKSMLDQVRAKCVSDVRKRDVEIEKLKGHLLSVRRGKNGTAATKIHTKHPQSLLKSDMEKRGGQDAKGAEWSLEQESNDILTALVNETSTENVSLRAIIEDAISTLRELSGLEPELEQHDIQDSGIGIPGQYRKSRHPSISAEDALIPCHALAEQLNATIEHCRSILRDPSFVPIEEVHVRDEEILKLKAGWERMADRWKEAVTMMSQWKQRMLHDGHAADMGEFSDLSFGRSIAVRPDGKPVLGGDAELSSMIFDHSHLSDEPAEEESVLHQELSTQQAESEDELVLEPPPKRLAASPARRGVKLPRPIRALGEVSGNNAKTASWQVVSVSPHYESDASPDEGDDDETTPDKSENKPARLTVPEKLAAVEAEAKKIQQEPKKVTQKRKSADRITTTRRTNRRRSTLRPEELAALMGMR